MVRQTKNRITIMSIIGIFSIMTSLYAFHGWHVKKMQNLIVETQEQKFELINIKLDMLLTPEQIRTAHERFKLIQETRNPR